MYATSLLFFMDEKFFWMFLWMHLNRLWSPITNRFIENMPLLILIKQFYHEPNATKHLLNRKIIHILDTAVAMHV